jgi:thiamine biosynthesis lipoprotein
MYGRTMVGRRRFLAALGAGAAAGLGVGGLSAAGLQTVRRTGRALGATTSLTVHHADAAVAERAISAGFAELNLVEDVMSLFRPNSELCRLNRAGVLERPHPYLVAVLTRARELAEITGGAFDVTVQPLWELYAAAAKIGRAPALGAIEAARRRVDYRRVELRDGCVRFTEPGTAVTLNGIARGFAADRLMDVLRRHGVEHARAAFGGGDVDGAGIDGRFLSTSAFDGNRPAGVVIDPRTGRGAAGLRRVTVAAGTGMDADGLSTAIFALCGQEGPAWARVVAGADVYAVHNDGRAFRTAGFPARG